MKIHLQNSPVSTLAPSPASNHIFQMSEINKKIRVQIYGTGLWKQRDTNGIPMAMANSSCKGNGGTLNLHVKH